MAEISVVTLDAGRKSLRSLETGVGTGLRFVTRIESVASTQEMIVSDFIDIAADGCLDIDGLVTILGE
jgi:hypothetical protein